MEKDLLDFDLPQGWTLTTLGAIGELGRGKSKHRPRNEPRLFGGKFPFVQTGDIKAANGVLRSYTQTYNELGLAQSKLWPAGTLCITIAANIGDSAILGMDACFPDSIVGFIPKSGIDIRFVEYFLRTIRADLDRLAPATAQKNINLDVLERVKIPVPPLAEQERIVEAIEAQLSRIEAGVVSVRNAQRALRRYKASVLNAACTGQLLPQDPTDEPATFLLERILAERRERWEAEQREKYAAQGKPLPKGWQDKYPTPATPDTTDLPDLPEGWVWATAEQVCSKIQDGTHFSPKHQVSERLNDYYLYLTSKNVREFRLDLTDVTYVDKETHESIYARCSVEYGDVMLVKDGVNTGTVALNTVSEPFSLLSSVALLRPFNRLNNEYLQYIIGSPLILSQVTGKMSGTAIKRIILEQIRSLSIPLPSLVEQFRIVAEVERRLSVVAALEHTVTATLKRAARLRQGVLRKAFRGKLVVQEPDDESAEALLAEVREGRAKQGVGYTLRMV